MYACNSHSGRSSIAHDAVRFRLNQDLVSHFFASGLFQIWNRRYTDYSLTLKNTVSFKTTEEAGGLYQLATIKLVRDFMEYKHIRVSRDYVCDGSLYFDFKYDIPNAILDIFCTDVSFASARLELFKHCTKAKQGVLDPAALLY